MAEFTAKVPTLTGESDFPAKTCGICKGIGYLTEPFEITSHDYINKTVRVIKADSGDKCPACLGRGWVGVVGGEPRPMPPPLKTN